MTTINKALVPVKLEGGTLTHGKWCIDKYYGLRENNKAIGKNHVSLFEFALTTYDMVYPGEVFILDDNEYCFDTDCVDKEQYPFDDPSLYMMKMKNSNWSLTGDNNSPLEIDNNIYDKVWVVNNH